MTTIEILLRRSAETPVGPGSRQRGRASGGLATPRAGRLDLVVLAQIGCALAGGLCIAAAAIFDLAFVRTYFAADGIVTPSQAAALPAARVTLAGFGAALLMLAACLKRILAAPWLTSFLASRRRVAWAIFLAPLVILLAIAGYKAARGVGDPLYLLAVREDSLVEWLTAFAYLAAVGVAWSLARKLQLSRRYLVAGFHALLGACCLFVALEEVSYGQRLLGFGTPEPVAARNLQNEMTIHNLDFVERLFFTVVPLAAGLFGLLGCAFWALRRRLHRRWVEPLSLMLPPWFLVSWFLPIALFAFYATFLWGQAPAIEWQDQEPLEALLALGFLAFLLDNLWQLRREDGFASEPDSYESAGEQPIFLQARLDQHRRHDRLAL